VAGVPRVGTLGFYEADFVKTGGEYLFSFYFLLVLADIWRQPTCLALALDYCGGVCAASDQTPKSVTSSSA
jgi:hypothetical protein